MSRLRFVPIVVCALALHAALAEAQQAPAPRTLASISHDSVFGFNTSPNGRFIMQVTRTGLRMYDVASRQSWSLVDGSALGLRNLNWSPRGDMIAYVRAGDGGSGSYVWAMPVDAATGRARGPAQRVTTGQGNVPSLSFDGRWIAFARIDSGEAWCLAIVPATGGPERVLARFCDNIESIYWSTDDKTIYLGLLGLAPPPDLPSIVKIRVDGGAQQVIRSRNYEWIAGMTADRRHLVLVPVKSRVAAGDRATVIDTAGREVGHVPLPVGDMVQYDGVLGDSALVWVAWRDHTMLEMRPVAGGRARRLPLIGESDDVPLWSPDGTRIAFQVRGGGRTSLAVMDADGTNPRVYRESDVLADAWGAKWSPDSRSVAFLSPDRYRMSLLDVATGAIRTVLEDSIGNWRWRADGQALVLRSRLQPGGGIYEVTLNGQRRQLVDLPIRTDLDLPVRTYLTWGFQFVGNSNVFVRSDSAAFLMPLGPGPARRLASVPPRSQLFRPVVSHDLRWVVGLLRDVDASRETTNQVELFSLETGARTVLDLPFSWMIDRYPPGNPPLFLPGDSTLLLFGQRNENNDITLYRVPLNGAAPSVFADVGKRHDDNNASAASASPDGRSVVYGVQPEGSTGSFLLIDLRDAVPRATSRSPRR